MRYEASLQAYASLGSRVQQNNNLIIIIAPMHACMHVSLTRACCCWQRTRCRPLATAHVVSQGATAHVVSQGATAHVVSQGATAHVVSLGATAHVGPRHGSASSGLPKVFYQAKVKPPATRSSRIKHSASKHSTLMQPRCGRCVQVRYSVRYSTVLRSEVREGLRTRTSVKK